MVLAMALATAVVDSAKEEGKFQPCDEKIGKDFDARHGWNLYAF